MALCLDSLLHSIIQSVVDLKFLNSNRVPPWLAWRMHAAVGAQRLLVRVSMCLLHSFSQVFGEQVQYVYTSIACQNGGWKWKETTDIQKIAKVYWKVHEFGTSLVKTGKTALSSPGVASVLATGATDGTGDASAGVALSRLMSPELTNLWSCRWGPLLNLLVVDCHVFWWVFWGYAPPIWQLQSL